jgi:capsid protein
MWFQNIFSKFRDSLSTGPERSRIWYLLPEDSRDYLDALTREEVARRTEAMMDTFGMVKEAVRGVGRHTVGKGISLQLNTSDIEWNVEAEADFEQYFSTPERFDIAGRRSGYDAENTWVEQRIIRGEAFGSMTENPEFDGEPCWQLWDSTEIRTPDSLAEDKAIYDGVRLSDVHKPLGYYAKANNAKGYVEIPANKMRHWYQPLGINQVRGVSDFAPVVHRLVDWRDLEKLFIQHAKTQSALAVAVKKLAKVGKNGLANRIKRESTGTGDKTDTAALEKAFPGLVSYLGADGDVQLISGNSPSDKLQPFLTTLIAPDVFLSAGLPSQFFLNPELLTGANQRFILARADLLFQTLGEDLIYRFLRPAAFRYLSWRIEKGKLRKPADPNWAATMTWQTPKRITVDNGRDGNLTIQLVGNGMENLRGWYDQNGKFWRSETLQWIREWKEFDKMCRAEGMSPEMIKLMLQRWRPGMPGAGGAAPDPTTQTDTQQDQPSDKKAA